MYYEQWRPAATHIKDRHLEGFLGTVDLAFKPDPIDDTGAAVAAVMALLSEKVSAGEIADVRQSLSAAIRDLWPTTA